MLSNKVVDERIAPRLNRHLARPARCVNSWAGLHLELLSLREFYAAAREVNLISLADSLDAEEREPIDLVLRAQLAQADGEWKAAAQLWSRLLAETPIAMVATLCKANLANCYVMLGQPVEAFTLFAEVVGLGDDDEQLSSALGLLSDQEIRDDPEAYVLLRSVLSLGAEAMVARSYLGLVDAAIGFCEISLSELDAVIADGSRYVLSSGHPTWLGAFYALRSMLLSERGKHAEALESARSALALLERDPDAIGWSRGVYLCQIGEELEELKSWDEALATFTAAAADDDLSIRARATRGIARVLRDSDSPAKALPKAFEAVAIAKRTSSVLVEGHSFGLLAQCLASYGELRQASAAAAAACRRFRAVKNCFADLNLRRTCGRVRLAQAQHLMAQCGHSADDERLGESAARTARQALRWWNRLRPLAARLDERAGTVAYSAEVSARSREARDILARLATG